MVNELKIIYEKMGIDIWEVINLASTKPFGYMPFFPGPGLGGHCIPIDPFYLSYKAEKFGIKTEFIKLAGKINTFMPKYVIKKCEKILKNKLTKNSNILIIGMSYKKNVGDIRESPSLEIMNHFINKGYKTYYYDMYFKKIPNTKKYPKLTDIKSIKSLNTKTSFDLGIILTDHDNINYKLLRKKAKYFIDTRNIFEKHNIIDSNIYKA